MALALFIAFGGGLAATALYTFAFGPPRRQWVRVAVMTGLAVVGSFGVWRAAVDADRVEPVWLDVGTGIKPLTAPIRVLLPPDLDTYVPAVRAAMRMWSERVGCRLFTEVDGEHDVRVLFLRDEPCDGMASDPDKNVAASTYFCAGGGVDIAVQRLDEIQGAYVVFAHELGHVLGLAHDPTGLMAPVAGQLMLVYPSEKDTAAVRDRYCTGVHK